jgi:hypothetical protein
MHKIGEKMGLSHGDSDKHSAHSSAPAFEPKSGEETSHQESAPVTKEHVHEHVHHKDQTQEREEHERTKVHQKVQPLKDERQEGTHHRVEDHGTEVHEHGHSGLDSSAERELEARRAKIAEGEGRTVDHTESSSSSRPDVDVNHKTHHVTETIPVVERDVYKPTEVEHRKEHVDIIHDKDEVGKTEVAPAMDVKEWEKKH